MKHTEGNWWADDHQHIHNDPIGSVKVAKVSGANFDEAKANARLISAAPDLLEALEKVLEELRTVVNENLEEYSFGECFEDVIHNYPGALLAKASIRKARGEA